MYVGYGLGGERYEPGEIEGTVWETQLTDVDELKCRCGYEATDARDLDEHVMAMMHVFDGTHHG